MSEPATIYLRRGQVLSWLEEEGISRATTRKLMEDGVIVGMTLHVNRIPDTGYRKGKKRCGGRRGPRNYFNKLQIKKELKL